jgi:hypothetical protein
VLYAHPGLDAPIKIADFGFGKILDIHGHSAVRGL